jgi:predicted 3-demethylubiquinone-9 3-methyltransferase (glyoxalase superfamily)
MSPETVSGQKITPCLWFEGQAEEAAAFYVDLFNAALDGPSQVGSMTRYDAASAEVSGMPEGTVLTVDFTLAGHEFVGLNGGPLFKFTPAVSFMVSCPTPAQVDHLWPALSDGGQVLMALDSYPFSERYGWLNDRYGVSWQISLAPDGEPIVPSLLFVGQQNGRAEEAIQFYTSLLPDSAASNLMRYGPEQGEMEGNLMYGAFQLAGQAFAAMDGGLAHDFTFNEAVSLLVKCADQAEVDRLWAALTAAGGEESYCGWLKDRFGVSWQIVPQALYAMLNDPDGDKARRVTEALLQMRKLDLAALEQAHRGESS